MVSKLFAPILSSRLFDPMPLPRRVRVVSGKYRVPRNRVAPITPSFNWKVKRIPSNR